MLKQSNKQKQNNEPHGRLLVAICSQEILKMPTYLKILILRVLLENVIRPNSKTSKHNSENFDLVILSQQMRYKTMKNSCAAKWD